MFLTFDYCQINLEVGMMVEKKSSSPRSKTWLAGALIILGVTIICVGTFFEVFWYDLADVGCAHTTPISNREPYPVS